MALVLAHITFDCQDAQRLAEFWQAAMNLELDGGGNEHFASLDDNRPDRPSWFFIKVPESKVVKNRLHVDLTADDRETEVGRLMILGATRVADHKEWGAEWTVMQDPEGNEFCVGQQSTPLDN